MTKRYEGRQVGQVEIYGLGPSVLEPATAGDPGVEGVSGSVLVRMESLSGGFGGPQITIELAIDHSPDSSVRDAQQQLLTAAHELLTRIASEPLEALQAKYVEGQSAALMPRKE